MRVVWVVRVRPLQRTRAGDATILDACLCELKADERKSVILAIGSAGDASWCRGRSNPCDQPCFQLAKGRTTTAHGGKTRGSGHFGSPPIGIYRSRSKRPHSATHARPPRRQNSEEVCRDTQRTWRTRGRRVSERCRIPGLRSWDPTNHRKTRSGKVTLTGPFPHRKPVSSSTRLVRPRLGYPAIKSLGRFG